METELPVGLENVCCLSCTCVRFLYLVEIDFFKPWAWAEIIGWDDAVTMWLWEEYLGLCPTSLGVCILEYRFDD